MKANIYKIITECIESGIRLGWGRAHKHTDTPGEDVIKERIESAIMEQICEYFEFDDYGNV